MKNGVSKDFQLVRRRKPWHKLDIKKYCGIAAIEVTLFEKDIIQLTGRLYKRGCSRKTTLGRLP